MPKSCLKKCNPGLHAIASLSQKMIALFLVPMDIQQVAHILDFIDTNKFYLQHENNDRFTAFTSSEHKLSIIPDNMSGMKTESK